MEKEQPDSLATVAVGGKEIPPPPHSHYAPSEVYSTAEPPPAYMRPGSKSTAVQIARIIALTLVAMSVILGCFILAGSYVQARASCTPEAIAALQAEMRLQQHQHQATQSEGEFFKHLQPEALVQDPVEQTDNSLQSLSNSVDKEKEVDQPDTKDIKIHKEDGSKIESGNSDSEDDDNDDDDYDDDDFPPVHIKLPLQLDLDDIAGTLMQQARSRVSCVVERKRADEVTDGSSDNGMDNSTDPQRYQRLSGERVAIFCESGNPQQDAQDQEMMNPIIVPLGTVQIPLQPQDPNAFNHYQVPDMQQLPLSDPRGLNHIPPGLLPPAFRGLPQLTVDMRPPRMGPQLPMMGPQIEMRQIPIEFRHFPMDPMRAMHPPMPQSSSYEQHQPPMMPPPQNEQPLRTIHMFHPEHQMPQMVPPRPEPANNRFSGEQQQEQQSPPMMPHQKPPVRPMIAPVPNSERHQSPFQGIPIEIRRIIQQVPMEIKNIIQHITSDSRPLPTPEGARREVVQEFKPFPDGARPIPLGPFPLPVEVRNLLEHGNIEGRRVQQIDSSEEQQQQQEAKPFPGPEDQGEEAERNFPVPVEVRNLIHQVVEGRAFPVPRFPLPLKPVESLEVPVEARAEVSEDQSMEEPREHDHRPPPGPVMLGPHPLQQEQDSENRPHYVQPRSVRSIPEPFAHRREKRVRRCACDCAC